MFKRPLRFLPTGMAAAALLTAVTLSASAPAAASVSVPASVPVSVPVSGAPVPARAAGVTALGYNSTGWTYRQVPPGTDEPAFYERGFDDSDWPLGRGGFGTSTGCSFNTPENVHTAWAPNTDMLVRHWVHIPRDAQQVRIQGTIDNDARVYFNGHLVQTALSGSCATGAVNAAVPDEYLECCNVLAIRGHDYGGSTYLNVRVTYVKPTARTKSTSTGATGATPGH